MTEQGLINDPAISFWLKEQIRKINDRDLLDAINDAELLLGVLAARYKNAFGVELYKDGDSCAVEIKCDSHEK